LKNFELKDTVKIDLKKENIMRLLRNSDILRIYFLGFIEHFCYASTFFILPILIKKTIELHAMWKINAPMGIIGTCFMFYFARRADKNGTRSSLKIAILLGIIGSFIAIQFNNLYSFAAAFIIIYSAHCILQAILPAIVSKYPDIQVKGTAMGIYITFEAVGASCGGLAGGWLQDHHEYCFLMLIGLFVMAFVIIAGFKDFRADIKNV
jgi:MFS family permease